MKTTVGIYLIAQAPFYYSKPDTVSIVKPLKHYLMLTFNGKRATYNWEFTKHEQLYNLGFDDTVGGVAHNLPNHVATLSLLNIEDLYDYLKTNYPTLDHVKNTHPELFI